MNGSRPWKWSGAMMSAEIEAIIANPIRPPPKPSSDVMINVSTTVDASAASHGRRSRRRKTT